MKKLLYILFFLLVGLTAIAQETPPSGLKAINAQFYIHLPDSTIWQQKGTPYNWHRVAKYSELQALGLLYLLKSDSAHYTTRSYFGLNGVKYSDTAAFKKKIDSVSNSGYVTHSYFNRYGIKWIDTLGNIATQYYATHGASVFYGNKTLNGDLTSTGQINANSFGVIGSGNFTAVSSDFTHRSILENSGLTTYDTNPTLGLGLTSYNRSQILYSNGTYGLTVGYPTITANRSQTFQDASGVIALLGDIPGQSGGATIVNSFNSRTGAVTPQLSDYSAFYQPLEDQRLSTTNSPSFVKQSLTGTGGNGYLDLLSQSASPATSSGHLRLYSDSLNRLSWKNSTYRRTIRVTRASDQTIQVPYRLNPILADSTDAFLAISLKQPRVISALPTQTTTRPIVGDSVNQAFAKIIFRGDSLASAISAKVGANPTATIGLSTINGSATTFMRSDAVPALSQAIVPTWTGLHTFQKGILTSGSYAAPAWGTSGVNFQTVAATYTDNTSSGAVSGVTSVNSFGQPILAASSPTTYAVGSTLTIMGAPTSGANVTQTFNAALNVIAGFSVFAGGFVMRGDNNYMLSNLFVPSSTAANAANNASLLFGGSSSIFSRVFLNGNGNTTLTANSSYSSLDVGSSPFNTAATGTHPWAASAVIKPIGTITSGGASVTNAANILAWGRSGGATNNYVGFFYNDAGAGTNNTWFKYGITRVSGLQIDSTATAQTQAVADNSTKIATDAFVQSATQDVVNTATDANYTITSSGQFVKLPVVTANRTVSIPTASSYTGRIIRLWNQNTSGTFSWSFTGATVKDAANNTLTSVINTSVYILESDGTNWIKQN